MKQWKSRDLHLVGCDINPLAHLITKVKLQGVNSHIYKDIIKLKALIENSQQIYPLSFPNMDKWFREDIIESLTVLRSAIIQIDDFQNRLFFWYLLCDVIRRYSNTRSSTCKLHIKESGSISRMENYVIDTFVSSIELKVQKFSRKSNNFVLYKCDTLIKLGEFDDREFDFYHITTIRGERYDRTIWPVFYAFTLHYTSERFGT